MYLNIEEIDQTVRADTELAFAARLWTGSILLQDELSSYNLSVVNGTVLGFGMGEVDRPSITVSAGREIWERLLAAVPEPFYQDPMMGAANTMHELTIVGDTEREVFPYYPVVQRLLSILRENRNGPILAPSVLPIVDRKFDSSIGRYIYLTVQETQYRVYFEEAGEGVPIIFQHTAGSDSRQFRYQLEDTELQEKYRMIAYDLPYHGRSIPPTSRAWWTEEYQLTQSFLLEFVVEFVRALQLDVPVFMGCSLGGVLAPDLARYHPDKFRAVIGINGHGYIGAPPKPGTGYTNPRVGADWKSASMIGIVAPGASEAYRREIGWCYSQGAPTVLHGDLNYYHVEHDLRGQLDRINTEEVAVYLLAGEYDRSVFEPYGSEWLARGISGAHYEVVAQGGHFLMAENPVIFKPIFMRILSDIEKRASLAEGS